MADIYVPIEYQDDPDLLADEALTRMESSIPGFIAHPASPTTVAVEETTALIAETRSVIPVIGEAVFDLIAATIWRVPRDQAVRATGQVRVISRQPAPAGGIVIQSGLRVVMGQVQCETTIDAVIVQGADRVTIPVAAVEPGEYANGASDPVLPVEFPEWLLALETVQGLDGGVDEEDPMDHRDRVARNQELNRPTWVRVQDGVRRIMDDPEVARVLGVDMLNLPAGQDGVEDHVAFFPIDAAGDPVSEQAMTRIAADLEDTRGVNVNVHLGEPTVTVIDARYQVVKRADSPISDVDLLAACDEAIAAVFSRARWGIVGGRDRPVGNWEVRRLARYGQVYDALYDVDGVADVVSGSVLLRALTIPTRDEFEQADIELPGFAPLAQAGDVQGQVVAA